MKCVIPCAGESSRMNLGTPKVLLEIAGRSILGHVTYQWSALVDGFVIVVSRENENLIRRNSGRAEFVVQDPLKGIADAILRAEPYIVGRFVVALGDCLYKGRFESESFELGVGVWRTDDLVELGKSYLVVVHEGLVGRVTEKPIVTTEGTRNCGMGVYFLDTRVFDYIKKTPPSELRHEVEITDVIQNMIDAGENITPVWFEGKYINVTYPADIKKAEEIFNGGTS